LTPGATLGELLMSSQLSQNYFELFGLPQRFDLELAQLTERYRELQTRLHPDRFSHAGAAERRLAAQKAALVNEAFRTLKDSQRRAEYLLSLRGTDAGTSETDTTGDGSFLMRQMELREAIDEAAKSPDARTALRTVAGDIQSESSALERQFAQSYDTADLKTARAVAQKMQFFKRLMEDVSHREEALDDGADRR
jgi:molecular chaperone HscB